MGTKDKKTWGQHLIDAAKNIIVSRLLLRTAAVTPPPIAIGVIVISPLLAESLNNPKDNEFNKQVIKALRSLSKDEMKAVLGMIPKHYAKGIKTLLSVRSDIKNDPTKRDKVNKLEKLILARVRQALPKGLQKNVSVGLSIA
jgi:hypothetical protein